MKTCKKLLAITIALVLLVSTLVSGLVVSAADATTTLAIGTTTIKEGTTTADVEFVLTFAAPTKTPHSLCTITAADGLTLTAIEVDQAKTKYVKQGEDGQWVDDELITDEEAKVTIDNDGKNLAAGKVLVESAADSKAPTVTFITFVATFAVAEGLAEGTYAVSAEADATNWSEDDIAVTVKSGAVVVEAAVVEPDCEHEWSITESKAASGTAAEGEIEKGNISLVCLKCGEEELNKEVSYFDSYRATSVNLDLESEIIFNYYVKDSAINGAEEVFFKTTLVGAESDDVKYVTLEEATDDTTNARQVIKRGIPAKMLVDQLVLNTFVKMDGTWYSGRIQSYSVVNVAHLRDNKANAKEYAMYGALLKYGAAAQTFFNYRTDNLADSEANMGMFATYAPTTDPEVVAQMTNNRGTQGVRFRAYDYDLSSKTILNLKFTVNEATEAPVPSDLSVAFKHTISEGNDETYVCNYEDLTYESDNDRYVANFGELAPKEWRDGIVATIRNKDVDYDCSFVTSIAGLMQYSIEKGQAKNNPQLAATYKAMINFGDYANAFFNQ